MPDIDDDTPALAEEVEANLAIEQGLGVGARELAAQREAGGVVTEDEDPELENGVSIDADENVSVQGLDNAG